MKGGLYALQSNNCCLNEEAEGQGLLLNGKKMRWRDFSVPHWAGDYSKIKLFLLFFFKIYKNVDLMLGNTEGKRRREQQRMK